MDRLDDSQVFIEDHHFLRGVVELQLLTVENTSEVVEFDNSEIVLAEDHDCVAERTHADGSGDRDKGKGQETGHLLSSEGVEEPGARRKGEDCWLSKHLQLYKFDRPSSKVLGSGVGKFSSNGVNGGPHDHPVLQPSVKVELNPVLLVLGLGGIHLFNGNALDSAPHVLSR